MGIFGVRQELLLKGAGAAAKVLLFSLTAVLAWSCVARFDGDAAGGQAVADADEGEAVRQSSQAVLVNDDPYLAANRANLVPDPSFEFDAAKQWDEWSSQSTVRSSTKAYSGHHSIKVTDSSTTDNAGVVTQRVPAVPGRAYTASAWVQRTSGSGIPMIYLQFHDGLGSGTSDRIEARTVEVPVSNSTWKTASVSGVAPVGTRYVDVLVYSTNASVATFYVDDVALVAQDNLVPNGNFSEVEGGIPVHWSMWEDTEIASHAVGFDGDGIWMPDDFTDKARGVMSGRFAVFPGQVLTATGRSKYAADRPRLSLRFFASRTSTSPVADSSVQFPQGSGWKLASLTADVPVGAQYAEVLAYSCLACTGDVYFDDIRVTSARNLLLNGDAEDPESQEWSSNGTYTASEKLTGERSIRFEDSETDASVAVRSQPLPVVAGRKYRLSGSIKAMPGEDYPEEHSCKAWVAVEFYPSMTRTATSDRISSHQAPPISTFAGLPCEQHENKWVSRKLQVTAPAGAYAARVLLYSEIAFEGRYYADGIRFGEVPAPTPPQTFFVSPSSYNDAAFWNNQVLPALSTSAVEVIVRDGQYNLVTLSDQLVVDATNFETDFPLTVRGQNPTGTVFIHATQSGTEENSFHKQNMFSFDGFDHGITFRDLNFGGLKRASSDYTFKNRRVGAALDVRGSNDVEVSNVGFYDLHGVDYTAFRPSHEMSGVLFRDNYGARIGYDSHAHFFYCAKNVVNLQFVGNFLEDSTGSYVRFRNNCDVAAVIRNRVQATGTFYNSSVGSADDRNRPFIEWAIFNSGIKASDPDHDIDCGGEYPYERKAEGDEWLGLMRATLEDNVFEYLEPHSDDDHRYPYSIVHSGFNPPDPPPDGLDTLALLKVAGPGLTAQQIRDAFGVETDDWIQSFHNDFGGERAGQLARLLVETRTDQFYEVDDDECYYMTDLGSPDSKDFFIDDLLSLP